MLLLAMFVLNIRAMHAISFSGSWTQLMTTQALVSQIKNALNSATSNSASFQLFNNVKAFTFRCVINVTHFYDRNGNQYINYNNASSSESVIHTKSVTQKDG
eukprot:484988_1